MLRGLRFAPVLLVLVASLLLSACGGATTVVAPTSATAESVAATVAATSAAPAATTEATMAATSGATTDATTSATGEVTTAATTGATTEATAGTASTGTKPRLAIILSGPADDNSWNAAAVTAGNALKAKGYDVTTIESIADTDAARVLRQYADQGYNMIIAHSFSYQDAVFQVAPDYPKVNFAWAGGINHTAANVADYDQPFYEAAYLIGIMSAKLSKSGKLGALYGFDIPSCHSMGEALVAGAKTQRADATLTVGATGDWNDVAKGKEAALAQADTGVDFWIECGQGAALGAIEAAKEKSSFATGYVGDMSKLGPQNVPVSLVWNLEPLFQQMMDDTAGSTFANKFYRYGIAQDALRVTVNPDLQSQIPADAVQAVEDARAKIVSGALKVPFVPQ